MRPNPFRDSKPYNRVKIGGRQIKAALVAIDGHELTDDWNVQKGTNTNNATAAYRGVNLLDGVKLTFECADGDGSSAEEDYDDLSDIYDMMAPTQVTGRAGPMPPTLPLENAILTRIGLTAINRKAWKEYPTDTASWRVDITVIQYAPPSPAGAGAQTPAKKGSAGSTTAVDPQIEALRKERDALFAQAAAV